METLQDRVLPLAYGVAGRCVGLVQGACFALHTARASLFQKAKEGASNEAATGAEEPVVASPEKKQRISSPERSQQDGQKAENGLKPEADKKQAEPQQTQKEHPKPEQQKPAAQAPTPEDSTAKRQPETDKKQAEPQQPQKEAPKPEQQPEQQPAAQAQKPEEPKAQRQAEQKKPASHAPTPNSDAAKPANGMAAFPTPAEAAGAEVQQPVGEVTRLEDVTGVHQPAETFVKAAAKPPGPDADIVNNTGESTASEDTSSVAPSSATATDAANGSSKATNGHKKKKRSNSRKRKNGH